MLVVCDDLALPPGRMRLRARGSDGGHRGLRSVEQWLKTSAYPRLRIGVGGTPPGRDTVDHVLEAPTAEEQQLIDARGCRSGPRDGSLARLYATRDPDEPVEPRPGAAGT